MQACSRCKRRSATEGYKQCQRCRDYTASKMRLMRSKDPTRSPTYQREWNRRQRENVLAHYGGRCACCGETEFEFLSIDHIDGGGTQHRLEAKVRGAGIIRWLINQGYPDGFRVLCHNCNQAIGFYGACPHERVVLELVRGDE